MLVTNYTSKKNKLKKKDHTFAPFPPEVNHFSRNDFGK